MEREPGTHAGGTVTAVVVVVLVVLVVVVVVVVVVVAAAGATVVVVVVVVVVAGVRDTVPTDSVSPASRNTVSESIGAAAPIGRK